MELATKLVSLSFDDIMNRQVDRISMDSPLDPILANIFVGFYEKQLYDRFPKPYVYLRHVNDTVLVHVMKLCHSSGGWMIYILF